MEFNNKRNNIHEQGTELFRRWDGEAAPTARPIRNEFCPEITLKGRLRV